VSAYLHDAYERLAGSATRRADAWSWRLLRDDCAAEIAHAELMRQDASAAQRIKIECEARIAALSGAVR
jgi:hypothetical protein